MDERSAENDRATNVLCGCSGAMHDRECSFWPLFVKPSTRPASTPEEMCWCGEHPARFDHVGCDDDCPEDCATDHRGEQ